MKWIQLNSSGQLDDIIEQSKYTPQIIFKHSTRCSISIMAFNRLEREPTPEGMSFYYLDLLSNRALSNLISEKFNVEHQSPQVLLIKNGQCTYEETHSAISMDEILEQAK